MFSPLAQRNLFHDKVRLGVTLVGVAFAVVLVIIELALYFGFVTTISEVIDHAGADIWVAAKGTSSFDMSAPLKDTRLYQIKATPGVAAATAYIVGGENLALADGTVQTVEVIGFDPNNSIGRPWNIAEGSLRGVKFPGSVIMDGLYRKELGVAKIGDSVEIAEHRARVVAFTQGIVSIGAMPHVFTSVESARDYLHMRDDQINFVLVRVQKGADTDQVRENILADVKGVDVLTTRELARKTQIYWTVTTGAGIAIMLAALLGLVVGFVVVAQTIYATTLDHIKEFGTLKAIGAPNSYVYKVILKQAAISAAIGYPLGAAISLIILHLVKPHGAPVLVNAWILGFVFLLTVLMCASAAVISINKVTHVDPARVFRG